MNLLPSSAPGVDPLPVVSAGRAGAGRAPHPFETRSAHPILRRLLPWLLAVATVWLGLAGSALAQADPPGRVGRVARADGAVWWFDAADGRWQRVAANWPLTGGDRLSTGPDASAEVRIGSTTLLLGAGTELELQRVDDERLVFGLHAGRLALRLRSREVAAETEVRTAEAQLLPQRAGLYRIDRVDDTTWVGAWRGHLVVAGGPPGFVVEGARRVEIWREGERGEAPSLRLRDGTMVDDAFAAAVLRDDAQDEQRSAAHRFASPEMTGIEDLDRYGRWDTHPEYGAVWLPLDVADDWAPYRFGRWAWVQPWGWTWIDDARWGFAPSHYGRWVHWRGRWGWAPGERVARPVFAPALVAWIGGPALPVSIGLPSVGWLPLAPWERYVPWHRHTSVYADRVNRGPWGTHGHPGPHGPTPPGVRGYRDVPGAVTVVPRDVLWQQRPVRGATVDARIVPGQPLTSQAPLPRPVGPRPDAPGRDGPSMPRPMPPPGWNGPRPAGPVGPVGPAVVPPGAVQAVPGALPGDGRRVDGRRGDGPRVETPPGRPDERRWDSPTAPPPPVGVERRRRDRDDERWPERERGPDRRGEGARPVPQVAQPQVVQPQVAPSRVAPPQVQAPPPSPAAMPMGPMPPVRAPAPPAAVAPPPAPVTVIRPTPSPPPVQAVPVPPPAEIRGPGGRTGRDDGDFRQGERRGRRERDN